VQQVSWLVIGVGVERGYGRRQWIRSSKFCADGLDLVKDGCGGMDQRTEVPRRIVDG
jgi:hypothetical protein